LCKGEDAARIVRAPLIKPEAPIPATALPTINIFEDWAVAQRREPSSKTARKNRKVYFWNQQLFRPKSM
jgi:hypothetical protein